MRIDLLVDRRMLMHVNLEAELLAQAANDLAVAVVVSAVIHDADRRVLLVQRAEHELEYPGLEELPGGSVEENESLSQALARETQEETGLTVAHVVNYIGHFDYPRKNGCVARHFIFFVKVCTPLTVTLDPREHSNYRWVDYKNLDKAPCSAELRQILQNFSRTLPSIPSRCGRMA